MSSSSSAEEEEEEEGERMQEEISDSLQGPSLDVPILDAHPVNSLVDW